MASVREVEKYTVREDAPENKGSCWSDDSPPHYNDEKTPRLQQTYTCKVYCSILKIRFLPSEDFAEEFITQ